LEILALARLAVLLAKAGEGPDLRSAALFTALLLGGTGLAPIALYGGRSPKAVSALAHLRNGKELPLVIVVSKPGCGRCPSDRTAAVRKIIRNLPQLKTVEVFDADSRLGSELVRFSGTIDLPVYIAMDQTGAYTVAQGIPLTDWIESMAQAGRFGGHVGTRSAHPPVADTPAGLLLSALRSTARPNPEEQLLIGPAAILALPQTTDDLCRQILAAPTPEMRWAAIHRSGGFLNQAVVVRALRIVGEVSPNPWLRHHAQTILRSVKSPNF
jgi:hypothetical protein